MSQLRKVGRSGLIEWLSFSGLGVFRHGVLGATFYWSLSLVMVGYADTLAMFWRGRWIGVPRLACWRKMDIMWLCLWRF
jgi:hypothetical protein